MTVLILKGNQEHEDTYIKHELIGCVHAIEKICITFNTYVWRFSVSTNIDKIIVNSNTFASQQEEIEVLEQMKSRRNKLIQIVFSNETQSDKTVEI